MSDQDGHRSRRDPYRVVTFETDPDLPRVTADKYGGREPSDAYDALERAARFVSGLARPSQQLLTIRCAARTNCGPSKHEGAIIANVWRTPEGCLFVSWFVRNRKEVPTFEERYGDDAVVLRHPALDAERVDMGSPGTSAFHAHRDSVEGAYAPRGWIEAPEDLRPDRKWQPGHRVLVRDLLDRHDDHPDLDSVRLVVQCPETSKRLELDRLKVADELASALRHGPRVVELGAVLKGLA